MIAWGIVIFVVLLLFGPMLINNLRDAKDADAQETKPERELTGAERAQELREAIRRRNSGDQRAA